MSVFVMSVTDTFDVSMEASLVIGMVADNSLGSVSLIECVLASHFVTVTMLPLALVILRVRIVNAVFKLVGWMVMVIVMILVMMMMIVSNNQWRGVVILLVMVWHVNVMNFHVIRVSIVMRWRCRGGDKSESENCEKFHVFVLSLSEKLT
jgi:hypothetical protein